MDYSKIKLIVSDMDGTLLNSNHEVSEQFISIFKRLRERKIKVAVASGRQYYSLRERMDEIKEDIIYIAENGAIVVNKGEQLHLVPMQKELVHELIREVRSLGDKYIILCGRKQAYIESTAPEFMEPFLNHYEKYKVVDDLLEVEDDLFLKFTICDLSGAEENSLPHLIHFKDRLQVKLSGKIWIDFNDKQAQKGNALKAVQEKMNITREQTLAFGDYLNDIELFEHAAYSFAMVNAHKEVKEVATHQAASNDDLGVEKILQKLLESLEATKA